MPASNAVGVFICLVAAIAMFFAAPIVMPVTAVLGWLLIVLGAIYSFGVLVTIVQAYS